MKKLGSRLVPIIKSAAIFALLVCGAPLPSHSETEPVTVNFGIYSSVKPTEMIQKFSPVAKAIEGQMKTILGRPVTVKFQVAAKYEDAIKDLSSGKVDFSRFGPASFIEAQNQNKEVSMLAVESVNGSTIDYGVICVREDKPIAAIGELKGKSFAFGEENSTIGRYLSQEYLLKNGIKASDLAKYEYLGRHDAVGTAVGSGRFDAGALKEDIFLKLKGSGTPLKQLARFPNAAQVWVAKAGLNPEVKDALQKALLNLDSAALKPIGVDKLVEGKDTDYDVIRQAMTVNDQFFK